jgi:uncharacterized cupin superfamily protein
MTKRKWSPQRVSVASEEKGLEKEVRQCRQCRRHQCRAGRSSRRIETLDYIIVLSGEVDLEVDGEKAFHLKAGDVLVQRGGMGTWLNRGNVPAVMAAIFLDATPVDAGGKVLHTDYRTKNLLTTPSTRRKECST